jgi:PilZ domain
MPNRANTDCIRRPFSDKLPVFSIRFGGWMERPNGTAPSEQKKGGTVSGFASSVPTRRRVMRLPATRDVWVYWECGGRADVSHVRDLSTGGIFIETKWRRTKGDLVRVYFLVQEGQISLDSVVAQAQPSQGLGLKFQTVATKDIPKLTSLLDRVRTASLA